VYSNISTTDGGVVALTLDLAVQPGAEGCRRRSHRYMPGDPAGSRKNSERFRTQPITACEIKESCGYGDCLWSPHRHAVCVCSQQLLTT